jgi:Carboxypeptidase regulatory-like domain
VFNRGFFAGPFVRILGGSLLAVGVARPSSIGARVTGHVTSAAGGQSRPVPGAKVELAASNARPLSSTTTADGEFSFDNVDSGEYVLRATKTGYLPATYGSRRQDQPGTPIVVSPDSDSRMITLELGRGSSIAGTVRDSDGNPVSKARVLAERFTWRLGRETRTTAVPGATLVMVTDDRGRYRLYGLPPGQYLVGAAMPSGTVREQTPGAFYPSALHPDEAQRVLLDGEQDADGVDISCYEVPVSSIRGTVDIGGADSVRLRLSPLLPLMTAAVVNRSGSFEFQGIPPGVYSLQSYSRSEPWMWGSATVSVAGADVANVQVRLAPAPVLAGTVRVADSEDSEAVNLSTVSLTLEPLEGGPLPFRVDTDVKSSGAFRFPAVVPGTYLLGLSADGEDEHWTIRSAAVEGQDVLDTPVSVPDGARLLSAAIVVSRERQGIRGALRGTDGAPATAYSLVIFPADRGLWARSPRRTRLLRPRTDGLFTTDLPPGEYQVAVLVDVGRDDLGNPALFDRLGAHSLGVAVHVGRFSELNLTVASTSDRGVVLR